VSEADLRAEIEQAWRLFEEKGYLPTLPGMTSFVGYDEALLLVGLTRIGHPAAVEGSAPYRRHRGHDGRLGRILRRRQAVQYPLPSMGERLNIAAIVSYMRSVMGDREWQESGAIKMNR
jgi:hypothetical protein